MKVGIIVHSHTGNTLSVAERLRDKLLAEGYDVNLERVVAVNEDPQATGNVQLKMAPDVSQYDALIFGAPVRGFSLSPVMKVYLAQLPSLHGKKVGCFVTEYFPFPWMGGNNAIRQMKAACLSKEASVFDSGIVNWSTRKRERLIAEVLARLGRV